MDTIEQIWVIINIFAEAGIGFFLSLFLYLTLKAGSSAAKEKEEKPLSKKELAAKKKVNSQQCCIGAFLNLFLQAEEDELSDEDKQLKEELELCVTRLGF